MSDSTLTIAQLYDSLFEKTSAPTSARIPWRTVDSSLKSIKSKPPPDQLNTIFGLLIEHTVRTEQSLGRSRDQIIEQLKGALPYGGQFLSKQTQRGSRFSLSQLPPRLRDIINLYLTGCFES